MNKTLFILTISVLSIFFVITTAFATNGKARTVDLRTKILCKWYANRDHEKEFSPERWNTNKEWIRKFDWYSSCIHHVMYPVAK